MAISGTSAPQQFANFREFYSYYLGEHSNPVSRRLHVSGSLLAIVVCVAAVASGRWRWLLAVPVAGYLPAWIGHLLFEHNHPATFRHPLYSLRGDLTMLWGVLRGRVRW